MGVAMKSDTLRVRRQPHVLTVQIHRPEANNSINAQLTEELLKVLQAADLDEAVRVVVLEGLPDTFCTGLDFQEVATSGELLIAQGAASYYDVLREMTRSSKVMVSLVAGKVNAGGLGFVAASDLVIGGRNATFGLSELLFGLLPACVLPFLLRRVGFQKAQLLALMTQTISVAEAHRWGLVDEWGDDPEQLLRRFLPRLTRLSPIAVRRLKTYMAELWIIRDQTREFAVNTISGLLNDTRTQEKIRRFVAEGVAPWQT
jgi:polyketide biosynthesis enoyl-CoA hydratase PksH